MNEISNTDKFFECFYGHYGKNVSLLEVSDYNRIINLPEPSGLIDRDTYTEQFLKGLLNHTWGNLYGIGGRGKTSLVQLYVHKILSNIFGSVVYVPVENNIVRDFVNVIKNDKLRFSKLLDKVKLNDKLEDSFISLMSELCRDCTVTNKVNLLIFDINDTPNDDKGIDSFANNVKWVKEPWKVLLITHRYVEVGYNISLDENDETFALNLFQENCLIKGIATHIVTDIVKSLFYSPLLIRLAASQINITGSYKEIYKNIQNISVSLELHKETYDNLQMYLKSLVKLDDVSPNEQLVLCLFMIWPAINIPFRVICSFLRGYRLYVGMLRRETIHHDNDVAKEKFNHFSTTDCANQKLRDILTSLVKYNILSRIVLSSNANDKSVAYQMHGLLADALLNQYHDRINTFRGSIYRFLHWRHFGKYDFGNYIFRCKKIIGHYYKEEYRAQDDSMKDIFLGCISHSYPLLIDYNKNLVHKYNREFKYLQKHPLIVLFNMEQEWIGKIKKAGVNYLELFTLYKSFGDFYRSHDVKLDDGSFIDGFEDDFAANDQYKKAIEIYERQHIVNQDYTTIVNLYLMVADKAKPFEDYEFYRKAFQIYTANRSKCNLSQSFINILNYLAIDLSHKDDSDKHKALFYFHFGQYQSNAVKRELCFNTVINILNQMLSTSQVDWSFIFSLGSAMSEYGLEYVKYFIDIYEKHPDAINNLSIVVSLYLNLAVNADLEPFESYEYYNKAIAIYKNHKTQCIISKYYSKLMDKLVDSTAIIDGECLVKSDFFYNLACFFSQDEKYKDAERYFKAAIDCLKTMSADSDGNIDGCINTSYLRYYPEYDLTFIKVNGGKFLMGAQKDDQSLPNYDEVAFQNESPVHEVTLNDYYIGETQVTQRLWKAIMGEKNNPSMFQGDDNPVENVDWFMAVDFCNQLSQRLHLTPVYMITEVLNDGKLHKEVKINKDANGFKLPTEAEWEYAARGGKSGGTKYSGSDNIDEVAVYVKNSYDLGSNNSAYGTHKVKSKKPNSLGIYDMSGNVWESCQDWYGAYPSGSVINPTGPDSGSGRVLRGGSWYYSPQYCRVSARNGYDPFNRYYSRGFRLSLSSQQIKRNDINAKQIFFSYRISPSSLTAINTALADTI